ncbi:MAG: hypothetical protein LQ349_004619 [Xanthoria aureola]|nr:MAG: hypothetical protein LQ349_004619 [Xanthoria aureola]
MAAEAPDPKTFGSWEDAFQYPIAAVRGMERQLRNDIGSNREKLRSLVGASYRDLLGTAESIIEMDGQMQQVESYIGGMGMRCNSRLLGKKAANLRAWDSHSKATDRERYAFASQLAVLRSCPEVITRLLRTPGSVLLAAKVLVVSRLLHKKISQRGHPPRYLESLRNKLATLRRKLLPKIDRYLKSLESSESTLVEAMCAFSLATSSSSADVLRHFHHVRQSAVSELGQRADDDQRVSKSLQLVVKTLRDCQTIIPAQLARALETLKTTPLMEGLDVRSLRELNLDLHQRWLGDDINDFTPYIRHDDLQKTEANPLLEQWAKTAFSSFLGDLRKMVEKVENPAVVVQLRQELLELWLSTKRHSVGVGTFDILNGIRDAFNNRLKYLIHQQSANLRDVSASLDALLENWNRALADTCPPMWTDSIISSDIGTGGKFLKDELSRRAYSRTEPVRTASTIYTTWLDDINSLERLITQLGESKWADELDDMDDDDDTVEGLHNMLSEDDPHLLHKTFEDDLEDSFRMLCDRMNDYAKNLQTYDGEGTSAQKSAFLLRVWRDIASRLPSIYRDVPFESPFTPLFQTQVSKTVLQKPIAHCDKRISKRLQDKQFQARILWEGNPPLPVLPSPWAFRFLHETVKSMTDFGVDIWTPQAADILKQQTRDALAPIVKILPRLPRQVNGHDANGESKIDDGEESSQTPEEGAEVGPQDQDHEKDEETRDGGKENSEEEMKSKNNHKLSSAQNANGDHPSKPSGPSEEMIRDIKTQRLFDAVYLDYALSLKSKPTSPDDPDNGIATMLPDSFDSAQSSILDDLQMEDVPQWNRNLDRMRKDAGAYWKRTELLFALLA